MIAWQRFRPEEELLIRCTSTELSCDSRARISDLCRRDLDAEYVLAQAQSHGIPGMVYEHLGDVAPEHTLREALAGVVQSNMMCNLQHTRELVRLVAALADANIKILPFKGPMLGQLVYGNAALRSYQDIDVVVPREQIYATKRILRQHGYRPVYDLTPQEEQERIEAQIGYELARQEYGVRHVIELHWSFLNTVHRFKLEPEAVFERAETVTLGGQEMLTMSPEDLLLYLTAHGAKHHWERLKWAADVGALVRKRQDLDWYEALDRAEALGSLRMVYLGLHLAAELLDTPLPSYVQERVYADGVVSDLTRTIVHNWLFREGDARKVEGAEEFWFFVRTRERWRDNLPLVLHNARLLFNPSQKDREAISLPDSLSGLYYVIRPFRVLKQRLF